MDEGQLASHVNRVSIGCPSSRLESSPSSDTFRERHRFLDRLSTWHRLRNDPHQRVDPNRAGLPPTRDTGESLLALALAFLSLDATGWRWRRIIKVRHL